MDCKFVREGEILRCECCGYKIKTPTDKVRMMCKGGEGCTAQEYPSVFQMGLNAVTALVKDVANGMKRNDTEEIARRYEICKGCDMFDATKNSCFKCGCPMSLKLKMESEHCPIGKW